MKPNVLAYTCCYHDRGRLKELVTEMRATATAEGRWFNWLVCLGNPSERLRAEAQALLDDPAGVGIQYLKIWPENRGSHHATAQALSIARKEKYTWLLRLDDDVTVRTKEWLDKMITRLEELKERAGDSYYRFIAAPRLIGLENPIQPIGQINSGQKFPVEVVPILGGACRLHPVELLGGYEPDLYAPVGRGDPEGIIKHVVPSLINSQEEDRGMLIRFPDIRLIHRTKQIEGGDTETERQHRTMSLYWPWLGAEV
jgi:hypothetical protein